MKTKVLFTTALLAMLTLSSFAQEKEKRFGFEVSGGASFATRDLGGTDLKFGFGGEGIFHYRFMPHAGVYAGWGYNTFTAENSFDGADTDYEETGYVFGLQYKHPIGMSPVSYYVRAGGLYNHIEIENEAGDITDDTGHGFGWQVAGGVDVPLGRNWSLTPGLKFNSISGDITKESTTTELDLNYLQLRIGILKKF